MKNSVTTDEKQNGTDEQNVKGLAILGNMKQYSMVLFLVIVGAFFQFLTNGTFLRPLNVTNVILQNSHILILAIGMLMVIVLGHIDLSVGSVAAFVGAVAAILIINNGMNPFLAILLCLMLGGVIGAWQGFWIAYVKVPAFIVTLAGMLVFRGLTIVVLGGRTIASFPDMFRSLSSGFIPDVFGGGTELHVTTLLVGALFSLVIAIILVLARKKRISYSFSVPSMPVFIVQLVAIAAIVMAFSYTLASHAGIPNVLFILVSLIVIYYFATTKMKAGRYLYAIGGNEKAAQLSGIKTQKVVFWTFVNMGMLAGLSGLIFSARLNASTAAAGDLFELNAIAACFIGGASSSGGVGKVMGAIVGGLVMAIINNGMSLLGVGIDWQQAIMGLVLLSAVAVDVYNKKSAA
ncbi:MAG: sugar ABC transporter permease [Turicibacter sp.]|nr:sugar ABC transporter permease [Turicibacter sp.]